MESQKYSWHDEVSKHGLNVAECASALQKSIRRSDVDGALYWASELYNSGFEGYVWKRLFVILTEDIVADENPGLVSDVWALFQMSDFYKKKASKEKPAEVQRLGMTQAVIRLARAKKNRMGCHAMLYHFELPRIPREIPDHALDRHTIRGKRMGRNWDFFFEEASLLVDSNGEIAEPDVYQESVRAWLDAGSPTPQKGPNEPNPRPSTGTGKLF